MGNDLRVKHLEMIEGVINRMASNSFLLKGWSVTLAAAILALTVKEGAGRAALVALSSVVAFWALDAFYLRQERCFRKLYEALASEFKEANSATVEPFSMNTKPFSEEVPAVWETMIAGTVWPLHGVLAVVVIAVAMLVGR